MITLPRSTLWLPASQTVPTDAVFWKIWTEDAYTVQFFHASVSNPEVLKGKQKEVDSFFFLDYAFFLRFHDKIFFGALKKCTNRPLRYMTASCTISQGILYEKTILPSCAPLSSTNTVAPWRGTWICVTAQCNKLVKTEWRNDEACAGQGTCIQDISGSEDAKISTGHVNARRRLEALPSERRYL